MNRLINKVAVITGAASGFGELSAKLFAEEGASVVVADRDEKNGNRVVNEILAKGGKAVFAFTDVTKSEDCKAMVQTAIKNYGKLDIIFNNAGITGVIKFDFAHCNEEEFDSVFKVNANGVFYGIRHAVPELIKNGGGSIINTSSVVGIAACMGSAAYSGSKGAVNALTIAAANEYGRFGIRSNCISPYAANTPIMQHYMESEEGRAKLELFKSGNPMGKLVEPIQIAYAALFLASDESLSINGHNLVVDCGATIKSQPVNMDVFNRDNPY